MAFWTRFAARRSSRTRFSDTGAGCRSPRTWIPAAPASFAAWSRAPLATSARSTLATGPTPCWLPATTSNPSMRRSLLSTAYCTAAAMVRNRKALTPLGAP